MKNLLREKSHSSGEAVRDMVVPYREGELSTPDISHQEKVSEVENLIMRDGPRERCTGHEEDVRREVKKFYEVHTFQRSGSHAIYNWLFGQFEEPVLFFNNAKPFRDPAIDMRNPDAGVNNVVDLLPYWRDVERRTEIHKMTNRVIVVGFEDKELTRLFLTPFGALDWINPSEIWRVIILRDVYNWTASRYEKGLEVSARKFRMWKLYANSIDHYSFISYNDWFRSPMYRSEILDRLGIRQRNDNVTYVPKSGGGSSFDARTYQGYGDEMAVLERWKELTDPKIISLIRMDKELIDLNRKLFKMDYPWED